MVVRYTVFPEDFGPQSTICISGLTPPSPLLELTLRSPPSINKAGSGEDFKTLGSAALNYSMERFRFGTNSDKSAV